MTHEQPNLTEGTGLRAYIEKHPQSPLSARLAHACIEAGEYDTALQLCRRALEHYPRFPSLLFLSAKAHAALRQYQPARAQLRALMEEYPACTAAVHLLERMRKMEEQHLSAMASVPERIPALDFSSAGSKEKKSNWSWHHHLIPGEDLILNKRARDFRLEGQPAPDAERGGTVEIPSIYLDKPPEARIEESAALKAVSQDAVTPEAAPVPETESAAPDSHRMNEPDFRITTAQGEETSAASNDHNIEELAGRLEGASMPKLTKLYPQEELFDEDEEQVNIESRPVTETLAQIYVRQGKYEQAIEAYRKLREKNYDRRYEFTERISEIKRMIDEKRSQQPPLSTGSL